MILPCQSGLYLAEMTKKEQSFWKELKNGWSSEEKQENDCNPKKNYI